jgi:hypothetical protein
LYLVSTANPFFETTLPDSYSVDLVETKGSWGSSSSWEAADASEYYPKVIMTSPCVEGPDSDTISVLVTGLTAPLTTGLADNMGLEVTYF